VTVQAPVTQLTGLFKPILGSVTLKSKVESRIEQQITWTDAGLAFASPTPYSCP
jgi:hypothetical protein